MVSASYEESYAWAVTYNGAASACASGTGTDFSFTPDQLGNFAVTLTASDSGGSASSTEAIAVTGYADGAAPSLSISGAPSTSTPEGAPLALSASMTNPVTTYSYTWTVNDVSTGVSVASGTGTRFNFTPETADPYMIDLTATDPYGYSLSTSAPISAGYVAPTAVLSVKTTPPANGVETVTVTLSNGYDPSATEMAGLSYAFACTPVGGSASPVYTTSPSYSFPISSSGVYTVWGEVMDPENQCTPYQSTLTVGDLPEAKTLSLPRDMWTSPSATSPFWTSPTPIPAHLPPTTPHR